MRRQSTQAGQAIAEQTRTTKDMTVAAESITKQMALITRANREHSAAGEAILKSLLEVRAVTDRNAAGVQDSRRSTDNLKERTESLAGIATRLGRPGPAPRRRTNGKR
jgi:methyl-accepting chemotaxis protein